MSLFRLFFPKSTKLLSESPVLGKLFILARFYFFPRWRPKCYLHQFASSYSNSTLSIRTLDTFNAFTVNSVSPMDTYCIDYNSEGTVLASGGNDNIVLSLFLSV